MLLLPSICRVQQRSWCGLPPPRHSFSCNSFLLFQVVARISFSLSEDYRSSSRSRPTSISAMSIAFFAFATISFWVSTSSFSVWTSVAGGPVLSVAAFASNSCRSKFAIGFLASSSYCFVSFAASRACLFLKTISLAPMHTLAKS